MDKKKIYLLLGILMLIVSLVGSYAYFSWKTNESRLVLTVGDVESIQVVLKPYKIDAEIIPVLSYDNEEYVNVDAINKSNNSKKFELYYHVNNIDSKLKNNNFKYTITKSTDGGNTYTEIKTDSFKEVDNNTDLVIYSEKVDGKSTIKYKVYVWLSSSGDQSDVSGSEFNAELRARFDSSDNIVVDVPDGMIPIVFDTSNGTIVKTISSDDSSWYDYNNQLWANAILVTSSSRSNYLGTTGVTVNESDILAYYTYIPRYKYKIWTTGLSSTGQEQSIDIQFENIDIIKSTGSNVSEYITHPAFTFGDSELNGIWVGKFETTGTEEEPTVLPDVSSLRNQNVSTQFKTALKFSGGNLLSNGNVSFSGNNTYGLTIKANAHMMKNSEWGAVAYLSNSIYGANRSIYSNNSKGYYTGRSGGNVGDNTPINGTYPDQTSTAQSNTYGFYTWDGYLLEYDTNTKSTTRDLTKVASTTGNITGVYDMSGGAIDVLMGLLVNESGELWSGNSTSRNSGFTGLLGESGKSYTGISFPESKYYDAYKVSSDATVNLLTACKNGICYGQALSEINDWYSDCYISFWVSLPWVTRGGYYVNSSPCGALLKGQTHGAASEYTASRSVIINASSVKSQESVGPTITIGTNGNSGYVNGNISSTITVSKKNADLDLSTLKYIYSASNTAVPTINFTSGNSYTLEGATGIYYLIVMACDVNGLCTTEVSNPFYVDNTAPTGTISLTQNSLTVNVVSSFSDISGISKYYYKIQTNNSCGTTGYVESDNSNYSFSLSDDSTYYVCVMAKDNAGNISNPIMASKKIDAEMLVKRSNSSTLLYSDATDSQKGEMWTFAHEATEQTPATTDYRYIGKNPKNYITFNDEVWRIIGVFDGRIKIIRNATLGDMSWDYKKSGVGSSTSNYGSIDWTDSQLMYMLNPSSYTLKSGYTLSGNYIKDGSGNIIYQLGCKPASIASGATSYNCTNNTWSLNSTALSQISAATYYLGGSSNGSGQSAETYYNFERAANSWNGLVGLMYASDYVYTFANGVDDTCYTDTYNCDNGRGGTPSNSWLYKSGTIQWTLLPYYSYSYYESLYVFGESADGEIFDYLGAYYDGVGVSPVVYLKSDIKLQGSGTSSDPYVIIN